MMLSSLPRERELLEGIGYPQKIDGGSAEMPPTIDHRQLRLQFADDFNRAGALDPTKWRRLEQKDLDIWPSDELLGSQHKWQAWQEGCQIIDRY